jgi:hypothetical protein
MDRTGTVPLRIAELAQLALADTLAEGESAAVLTARNKAKAKAEADIALRLAVLAVVRVKSARFMLDHLELEAPATNIMRDWLAGPRETNIMLRGGVGTTKTAAAVLAVRDALKGKGADDQAGAVAWLKPDQLVSAVLHTYDPHSPKLAPLVVVDDVGVETKPGFAAALAELLDLDGIRVVMTCNLSRADFTERYGKDIRLIDRLRATTEVHDIPGASKRPRVGDF